MRPGRTFIPAFAVLAVTALLILSPTAARPSTCPRGYIPVDEHARDARGALLCVSQHHPESFREIAGMSNQRDARALAPLSAAEGPSLYRASLKQRAAMIAAAAVVPGANGTWEEYGKGPLLANDERFGTSSEGLHELNGRIDSLDYDPVNKRLFATFGTGGIWMSTNMGESWRSIGDNLPSQIVGAVAWTPAAGGTLVVVSGEPLVAGLTRTGIGGFYSRDLGKTWKESAGIPDGALGFQVAVDPTKPNVVYVANSKGLFRSADAGATFVNVKLPTGECAGKTDNARCLLANQVTDVVVQAPDKFGNKGGTVLAAVAYRASTRPFPQNTEVIESPENGLYRSETGLPGSFEKLTATGFTPKDRIGRVEMGVAVGPEQNHDYVYAIVQDAVLLRGGFPTIDAPEDLWTGLTNTTLNGVYVSSDFGDTWTRMGDTISIAENPATGSALAVVGQALLFAPGVQAWYNEWIKPDPTRQTADGIPTRLTFGLEEVWQNELTNQPANGPTLFKVIGRYFANENCMLVLNVPACPTTRDPLATSTTHPDQHDAIWIPDGEGGVTLVVGNDGGAYTQHVGANEELNNTKWGVGANKGFYTLLPYHAQAAKDGTVWMGLQDNGSVKIEPDTRKQYMAFGGDGFYVAVDPDNSNYAWSEVTFANMRVTTDGGLTWSTQAPPISGGQFSNPFVMDPLDSNHLLTSGREVFETVDGPNTCTTIETEAASQSVECSWVQVFNLGTRNSPGNAGASASGTDPANTMSAVDLHGANAYVGFCGPCDIISTAVEYKNGLATNVGGSAPPAKASTSGWHVAEARGLPNRTINAIEIDPADPKTVYVALGGYSGRSWRGPGTYGDTNKRIGRGNVWVSHDAGKSFRSISAGLPDAPANAIVKRGSQLLVGTDVGVFLSSDLRGTQWAALDGLPVVPVTSLQVMPGDKDRVLTATFGRGVWTYKFPTATTPVTRPVPPVVRGIRRELPATGIGDPTTGVLLVAAAAGLAARLRRRGV